MHRLYPAPYPKNDVFDWIEPNSTSANHVQYYVVHVRFHLPMVL